MARLQPLGTGSYQACGAASTRATETRVRLFRCALQLFSERGFPTSPSKTSLRLRTSARNVFQLFESKDHVLGVMAEIQLSKVAEALELQPTSGRQFILSCIACFAAREEPGGAGPCPHHHLFIYGEQKLCASLSLAICQSGRKWVRRLWRLGKSAGRSTAIEER